MPFWQTNQAGVWAIDQPRIRLSGNEHAEMKMLGIQARSNLSRVPHLRVRQPSVGETINKDAKWLCASRISDRQAATSLCLQLNEPILCEGLAVEIPCDARNLVTFEIPPGASLRVPEVLAEWVLLQDRPRDAALQGLNPG